VSSCGPDCTCDACMASTWLDRGKRLAAVLEQLNAQHLGSIARAYLPPFERFLFDAQIARRQRVAASVVTWRDPVLRPWERISADDAAVLLVGVFFDAPERVLFLLTLRAERQRAAQQREVQAAHERQQMGAIRA